MSDEKIQPKDFDGQFIPVSIHEEVVKQVQERAKGLLAESREHGQRLLEKTLGDAEQQITAITTSAEAAIAAHKQAREKQAAEAKARAYGIDELRAALDRAQGVIKEQNQRVAVLEQQRSEDMQRASAQLAAAAADIEDLELKKGQLSDLRDQLVSMLEQVYERHGCTSAECPPCEGLRRLFSVRLDGRPLPEPTR
jgi:chromosome segregation ATPase